MSIQTPTANFVTVNSSVVNTSVKQTFNSKVDIREINGKLFICKIEDGFPTEGAELILDGFGNAEISSLYGANGDVQNFLIDSELILDVDYESLTDVQKDDLKRQFEEALQEDPNITFGGAMVKINLPILPGSAIIRYTITYPSTVTEAEIDNVASSLSVPFGIHT